MRMPMLALLAAVMVLAPTLAQVSCPVENCQTCKDNKKCQTCEAGHYLSGNQKSCDACVENCRRCESSNKCSECEAGFTRSGNKKSCDPPPEPGSCVENCKECESSNKCSECKAGFTRSGNKKSCDPPPEPGSCVTNCKVCDSKHRNKCKTCEDGFTRTRNKRACMACPIANCSRCGGNGKCQDCKKGFGLLKGGICSDECLVPHCTKCRTNNPNSCKDCLPGFSGRSCSAKQSGDVCTAKGDVHFTTLDGVRIDFQGSCTYQLVETSVGFTGQPLKIHTSTKKLSPDATVSFVREVYAWAYGYHIVLTVDFIKVDDVTINVPWYSSTGKLEITKPRDFEVRFPAINVVMVYKADQKGSVVITLPEDYRNNIAGLCGNFDGDAYNDLIPKGGTEEGSHDDIGDSWLVSNPRETDECTPETPEIEECATDAEENARQYCSAVPSASSMDTCRELVEDKSQPMIENCAFDLCRAPKAMDVQRCSYAEELVCDCLDRSPELVVDWRAELNCSAKCEENAENKQNYYDFEPSCENPTPDADQSAVAVQSCERCVCKAGFFRLGKRCVTQAECGCVVMEGGDTYTMAVGETRVTSDCRKKQTCQSDSRVSEEDLPPCHSHAHCAADPTTEETGCVCNSGYHGDGHSCAPLDVCKCSASGDVHFRTCDGTFFSFQGNCAYSLASTECQTLPGDLEAFSLNLDTHNLPNKRGVLNTKVSWPNKAILHVYGQSIVMSADGIKVDGVRISDLPSGGKLKLRFQRNKVVLTTDFGLKVTYVKDRKDSGKNKVFVEVPADYQGHICGLCGNYNGNQMDDFTDRNGEYQEDVTALGDSFFVQRAEDASCDRSTPIPTQECITMKTEEAKALCAEMVSQCPKFTDMADGLQSDCVIDICSAQTESEVNDIKCDQAETIVLECNTLLNEPLDLNVTFPSCGDDCGDNEEHKLMSKEDPTCRDRDRNNADDRESPDYYCGCKAGFVRSGEQCVATAECGCVDEDDMYHEQGQEWIHPDKCRSLWTCKDHVPALVEKNCPPGFICSAEWTCVCPSGKVEFEGECHVPCQDAVIHCGACTDTPSDCGQCDGGHFLADARTCSACPEQCTACNAANNCTDCKAFHQVENGECTAVCQVDSCDECEPNDMYQCKTCLGSTVLQNGQCVQDCQSGSIANCVECDPADVRDCRKCAQGFILVDNVCKPCPDHCITCSAEDYCLVCNSAENFFARNGKCHENCLRVVASCRSCRPDQKDVCSVCEDKNGEGKTLYLSSQGNCEVCDIADCMRCDPATGDCEACKGTKVVAPDGSCQEHCQVRDSNCDQCAEGNVACETCRNGFFSVNDGNDNCGKCMTGCMLCNDGVSCEACGLNLFYNDATQSCDATCEALDEKCMSCRDDNPAICEECDKGFYVPTNGTCQECTPANCRKCQASGECKSCKSGFFLDDGVCKEKCDRRDTNCYNCTDASQDVCESCKDQFYLDANKVCRRCLRSGCAECDNTGACIRCIQNSPHHRIVGKDCHVCEVQGCDRCLSDSRFMCDEDGCAAGYVYFDTKCHSSCSDLVPHCANCNRTVDGVCTACEENYVLKEPMGDLAICELSCDVRDLDCALCSDDNECVECKPRYDLDFADGMCRECTDDNNCKECHFSGAGNMQCLNCNDLFFLNADGACQETCEADRNCETCDFNEPDNCVKCFNDTDFFVDASGTCTECTAANCEECDPESDGSWCETCKQGYDENDGVCLESPQPSSPPNTPEPPAPDTPEPPAPDTPEPPAPDTPEPPAPDTPEPPVPPPGKSVPCPTVPNCLICDVDPARCRFCEEDFTVNDVTGQCEDDRTPCDTVLDCGEDAECVDGHCECPEGYCGHGGSICRQRCLCKILGDPELKTFDEMQLLLGYPSDRFKTFTLTKNVYNITDPCSFDVEVSLGPVDYHRMAYLSTLPQNMTISILGELITLMANNEAYDGGVKLDLSSGTYDRGEFQIKLAKEDGVQFIEFVSKKCDIKIGFYRRGYRSEGMVDLPCKYAGDDRLTGLCGTCDGRLNDLKTSEGVDVSQLDNRFALIEESYKVAEFEV